MSTVIHYPGDFAQFTCAYGEPPGTAVIKQEFDDFQVDEELGFAPTGSGEHLFVRVRKQDLGTVAAASVLARETGAAPAEVGYSGMKDRRAVTTQWFSLPGRHARGLAVGQQFAGLQLLEIQANDRKLRIGSHRANRFRIRLRECRVGQQELETRLLQIVAGGVPNYYGPQRLGRQLSNVCQAQDYLAAFDDSKGAPRLPRKKKSMLLSAARSFLFNAILSRRVEEGSWNRPLPGEVFNLAGTSRFFKGRDDDDRAELERRALELDIHPTGLLAGTLENRDPYRASASVASLEAAVVSDFAALSQGLSRTGVQASRRALRLVPRDLKLERENEATVLVSFTLGAGGYATALLRELVRF